MRATGPRPSRSGPLPGVPRRRGPTGAAAAGIAVLVGAAGLGALPAAQAAAGCGVTYSITSQWPGGFGATVAVTDLGDPVTSWRLTWTFAAGQTITQAWSATVSQSGAAVTATNATWNGSLGTGQSASFGFNGSWNGSNPVPASFALNGVTCTGTVVPSGTPSPSSPSPSSPSPTPSGSPSGSPSPSGDGEGTLVPDPAWTCGLPDGVVQPDRGRLVLSASLQRDAVRDLGATPYGSRRVTTLRGGRFSGAKPSGGSFTGSVEQGGLGLDLTLQSGSVEAEDLFTLRTSEGTLIHLRGCGIGLPGSAVRVVADFEAPTSSAYAWLNTGTYVARQVVDTSGAIALDVYDVTSVPSSGPRIQLTDPAGVPHQSWNCATGTGTRGATVFSETVTLGSSLAVGASKRGTRNIVPITGGTTTGRVVGKVLSGGADYQLVGSTTTLDARYVLATDDGEYILVRNCGPIGRLVPTFETRTAGRYAFLDTGVFLSSDPGAGAGGVSLTFYERR